MFSTTRGAQFARLPSATLSLAPEIPYKAHLIQRSHSYRQLETAASSKHLFAGPCQLAGLGRHVLQAAGYKSSAAICVHSLDFFFVRFFFVK